MINIRNSVGCKNRPKKDLNEKFNRFPADEKHAKGNGYQRCTVDISTG